MYCRLTGVVGQLYWTALHSQSLNAKMVSKEGGWSALNLWETQNTVAWNIVRYISFSAEAIIVISGSTRELRVTVKRDLIISVLLVSSVYTCLVLLNLIGANPNRGSVLLVPAELYTVNSKDLFQPQSAVSALWPLELIWLFVGPFCQLGPYRPQ